MLHALGLEGLLEGEADEAPDEVRRLRPSARRPAPTRDFERADRLRDELAERGLGGPRHPGRRRGSCALG